jgi:hypothetical protein
MNYLFVLWADESNFDQATPEQAAGVMEQWNAYTESLREAGAFVSGDGLTRSTSATTVTVRDGQKLVTDGPFAESKEQIIGFYVIDVADLDEAIAWSEKVPSVDGGRVEIRPIMDYEAMG